jgi:hypothetical protein
MSERTARVAAASRRQLGTLAELTTTEALEVLGATSGLLLAKIAPANHPLAIALLREQTDSTLQAALREQRALGR